MNLIERENKITLNKENNKTFEEIVDKYSNKILKIAYLELNNFSDSEEVVQEVLFKIYRNLKNFKGNSSIYTWIYRITLNTAKSYKVKRKEHISLEDIEISIDYSSENEVLEKLKNSDLFDILNKLDFKYRRVLFLFYYEDLKIKEISEILDEREGTIKTWLSRGRKYLQKELLKERYNE